MNNLKVTYTNKGLKNGISLPKKIASLAFVVVMGLSTLTACANNSNSSTPTGAPIENEVPENNWPIFTGLTDREEIIIESNWEDLIRDLYDALNDVRDAQNVFHPNDSRGYFTTFHANSTIDVKMLYFSLEKQFNRIRAMHDFRDVVAKFNLYIETNDVDASVLDLFTRLKNDFIELVENPIFLELESIDRLSLCNQMLLVNELNNANNLIKRLFVSPNIPGRAFVEVSLETEIERINAMKEFREIVAAFDSYSSSNPVDPMIVNIVNNIKEEYLQYTDSHDLFEQDSLISNKVETTLRVARNLISTQPTRAEFLEVDQAIAEFNDRHANYTFETRAASGADNPLTSSFPLTATQISSYINAFIRHSNHFKVCNPERCNFVGTQYAGSWRITDMNDYENGTLVYMFPARNGRNIPQETARIFEEAMVLGSKLDNIIKSDNMEEIFRLILTAKNYLESAYSNDNYEELVMELNELTEWFNLNANNLIFQPITQEMNITNQKTL